MGDWREIYEKLVAFLEEYDPSRSFNLRGDVLATFTELREKFKEEFVNYVVNVNKLREAESWIERLKEEMEELEGELGLKGYILPKELRSFVEDPKAHLKKKIFLYMHDLLRGKLKLDEFERSASAAVRTSLRTNMRSVYQTWVLISLLKGLAKGGAKLVYPEYGILSLDRAGKQRGGGIPPNVILWVGGGYLSFFLEAPRPLGWEDSRDLRRAWAFYVALRPDILTYAGRVLNIVSEEFNPPIRRPDIIIECKELDDWYVRTRDMRGPFSKPLTAEEWRSRWIKGLYKGLAEALGVKEGEVEQAMGEKRGIRVKEPRLLYLYKAFYSPKYLILISRAPLPKGLREDLEEGDIKVYDGVGFDEGKLAPVIEVLKEEASKSSDKAPIILEGELADLVYKLSAKMKLPPLKAIKEALLRALKEGNGAPAGI